MQASVPGYYNMTTVQKQVIAWLLAADWKPQPGSLALLKSVSRPQCDYK